jgi:hypothetical protein
MKKLLAPSALLTKLLVGLVAIIAIASPPPSGQAATTLKTGKATPTVSPAATPTSDEVLVMDGKIYPEDSLPAECKDLVKGQKCSIEPFGRFHNDSKKEGDLIHAKSFFSDADGPQVTEESWQKDGHVTKAIVTNKALGKISEVEVKDGKVNYKTTEISDGKVKTSQDDAEDNLVVPSTVLAYVRPHFKEIMNGDDVKLKVAVLDRRESFTFNMKKIRLDKNLAGEDIMVMQFKPTSMIVQALVSPMYFYILLKTGQMYAFEGKSALRRKTGDQYKEMNVITEYSTSIDTYAAAHPYTPPCDTSQLLNKCEMKEGTPSENKTSVPN